MTEHRDSLDRVVRDAVSGRVSRRDFLLRAVALGLSLPAAGALLAACQAAVSPSPETAAPTAAPTAGSTAAPTAEPAGAPTPAPTAAPTAAGPAKGGTLVVGRHHEPASLVPCGQLGAADSASIYTVDHMYERVVRCVAGSLDPQPGLAESWTVAPDGMSSTFTLRDAKFSNGDPITAEDVAWSINRFIDPNVNAFYQGVAGSFKSASVVDPKTVKIDMKRVDGAFLDSLAMFVAGILPKAYFESLGADEEARQKAFMEKPVSSGPFMLKSWTRGQAVELVRNPNYWQTDKPYVDAITFLYLSDDNTRVLKLRSGEAQIITDVPYAQMDALESDPGLRIVLDNIGAWKAIWLNNAMKPFDDKNVRLALNFATPKEAILKSVLNGAGEVANSIIGRVKYTDPAVPAYPYDVEKAKAAMAASSVPTGFETKIVIVAGSAPEKQLAEILQAEWAKIGVKLSIEAVDVATIWERYGGMQEANVFSFPASFLCTDTMSEDNLAYVFFVPESGASSFFTNYNNPEVTALINELSGSTDEAKRKETFLKIQTMTMEDAPVVPLFFTPWPTGAHESVKDLRMAVNGSIDWENIWLKS